MNGQFAPNEERSPTQDNLHVTFDHRKQSAQLTGQEGPTAFLPQIGATGANFVAHPLLPGFFARYHIVKPAAGSMTPNKSPYMVVYGSQPMGYL